MTIAYVLKMYPRFSETFILNEILELERQGIDLRIYSLRKPDDGRFHPNLARVRAPVIYLPEQVYAELPRVLDAHRALVRTDPRRYARVLWYALTEFDGHVLKWFWKAGVLAEHLRAHPPEHLHAHFASSATRVALFAHLLTDIPFSFTAHAKDIFLNTVDTEALRDKMRAAQVVVTVSDFNQAYLRQIASQTARRGPGAFLARSEPTISPDRIRRLYNGIDLSQFDVDANHAPHSQREPLILAVGRLVEKKGFDVLIRACARLLGRDLPFRCEIIGKGPQEAQLAALIAELQLSDRVKLVGPKPQDQVVCAYQRAALFALPCVVGADGNRDGLPTVILEAMAMGLPVVSTDVTGVPEMVEQGRTGLIVPQNDADALADALARLLADPAMRERMGGAARARVQRDFDLQKNVAVLREWFTGSSDLVRIGSELFARSTLAATPSPIT